MKALLRRDYRDRNTGAFGMTTGVFQNIGERVSFRYIALQIRGIGCLSIIWAVKGWE